jgi:ArsR family transcriptional regulator, arsenate/arsenite/antimonite-responsive transcriptional repressor
MEDILRIFKALSDETRLRTLVLIAQAELCVCEVTQILNMGQSRISRHLNILRDAGLVAVRRQGTWMFYRLAEGESSQYHMRIVEVLRNWTADNDLVGTDLAKLGKCLAERGKDGHCPIPEKERSKI